MSHSELIKYEKGRDYKKSKNGYTFIGSSTELKQEYPIKDYNNIQDLYSLFNLSIVKK